VGDRSFERVLVRAPNWVGDFVMATAAFERLREGFPNAHLTVALRPYLRRLLSGSPWFDEVIEAPKANRPGEALRQARVVRQGRYDLAVVLPNSFETALVPFLAGVPVRLGYRQGRPGLLNRGLRAAGGRRPPWRRWGPRREPEPMPRYYARLLDLLELPPGRDRGVLYVGDEESRFIDAWLAERGLGQDGRKLVLFTPGASYGASKLWPADRFAELARRFAARGDLAPVILSGPAEVELANSIAEAAGDGVVAATDPVLKLDELKALVQRASLVVTTDTGPRHLAVAFDRPVVCLIGPTDPRYTDYGLDKTALIRKPLECSPCQRKVCPLGHHRCMRDIEVEEVEAAGLELLGVE
jgi:heptosyltransferase-2